MGERDLAAKTVIPPITLSQFLATEFFSNLLKYR